MKKKSFSLQKLPEISKQKKQRLNEKNALFQQKFKGIERMQLHNELMSIKLKPYETARTFKRQSDAKTQDRAHKIAKMLIKHEKMIELQPIREIEYQTNKKIMSSTTTFKTPSKKMDVDGYLKEKNDRLIEVELKQVEAENSRRQYLPSIVQTEKKTFPFYSEYTKKYEEQPFIKLQQKQDKLKIRFLNGFQKWISKSNLKQVHQNEPLTLQSYRKIMKNVQSDQIPLLDLPQNKEIIEKINIDHAFLNKMLNQVYSKKNPTQQIKALLKQQLFYNYEESVKQFNKMFIERRQVKRINRFQRKNKVSDDLKAFIDHHLVCSYGLQFLDQYMLSKTHYIKTMVQSYNIIGKLDKFEHFNQLYIINNSPKFVNETILSEQIIKYFRQQKDKIQNIIYSLEEHLNGLTVILYKDIEHIIFLNPRLVGTNYQKHVKLFIASFSQHLSRIIRSVLINSINMQLDGLVTFFKEYSQIKKYLFPCRESQTNEFQLEFSGINTPVLNSLLSDKIIHGPGVIPIVFTLKKWKRKRYNNIYKFIIQSRKSIRNFRSKQWRSFKSQEERIIFKDPLLLLETIIIQPLSEYLRIIHESQNVNGCIYNKKIGLMDFINLQQFKHEIMKLYASERQEKVKMYATYFELWQLYFMEKPYIDDFIYLYKSIKAIKLIEQEMAFLQSDLALIRSIPNIIEIQFIRLDVTQIKEKIETTILSFMKKILKTCEETLGKMLEYGYQQTIKAKKLNQVTPYTNLAQYIDFINFLNQRQVEKSIQKIAQNVVFIDLNMSLLQKYHSQIKFGLLQRYLQSGTWIKTIRAAATQNKSKTIVDPFTFLKGVKEKRTKIFVKYNKILKEIIQLMKVSQLKNATKLSILSKNIAHEMKEICVAADQIVKQQTLLELQYAPQNPAQIDQEQVYKTDLTFFYKQERFLKKYLQFWAYTAKLKSIIDNIYDRRVLNIDGIQFIRLLRQGQQLISSIKISTLNKRFLHLCDEVMHQIQPFLKCSKLFLFLTIGTQNYRVRVIKQLTNQSSSQEMKVDTYSITVRQLMTLPLMNLDWHNVYQIKEDQQNYEACRLRLNSIYLIIKNIEVNIKLLKGVGNMREYQVILIDEQTVKIVKKCLEIINVTQQKYGYIFRNSEIQEDLLGQSSKKIAIFSKSIMKLKIVSEKLLKYYPIFQLVYPLTYTAFEELNFSPYYAAYENLVIDMSKKADLAKKLTFATFFDDKVRISYDDELKKLQQFQIKFYTQMLDSFYNSTYFGRSTLEKQRILYALSTLSMESFNKTATKLIGQWCTGVKFNLQYENDYYICLQEFQTIHRQTIKLTRRQKLFEINKIVQNQAEKVEIKCGLLIIAEELNKQLQSKIEHQTFQIFKLIYEYRYNIKNIFTFYININNLFLQSVLNAMVIAFQLDLSLLYQNKYDLNLLLTTIQQNKIYNPKEKDNYFIIDRLNQVQDEFIAIINIFQEKQYCLEDAQKGRIKKMYAYHSIPRIIFQNFNYEQNKIWLDDIKQQKQDDFINNMHLSPSLNKLGFISLDASKIQVKQLEKKEQISNFDEGLSINHLIVTPNDAKHGYSSKIQKYRIKIIANIAPQHKIKDISASYRFELIKKSPNTNYIFNSYIAAQLLMEALHSRKILVTNIHPNYEIFGQNFLKTSKFIPQYNKNVAIIVHSPKDLLKSLKSILSYQRHKINKFIYIYYDKLVHQQIQTQQIDENCIVYQANGKLHLNNLLKKQLNYNERQIFKQFIDTQSHFESCHPFIERSQKIIPSNLLKFSLENKQKQLLTNLIYTYQSRHGLFPQITQQKIAIISQPIYGISDSHFILNEYFNLGQFIYTKLLKIASNDMNRQILNEFVHNMVQTEQHSLAAYVLPIYDFTPEELFTTVQHQSFEQKIFDRYDKEQFYMKKIEKPYFNKGILHLLIEFLSGKENMSDKWNQFKLKGFQDAIVKWFIIDISQDTPVCNEVFQFFMQSFSNNEYVFEDGSHFSTDFHHNQKLIKDHKHKLIFILHPKQLNFYKNDFPPIPIINESINFDPFKQFRIFLTSLSQSFSEDFMGLIKITLLLDTFKQVLGCVDIQTISVQSIETMKRIFFIMINEVRKREIALGHYNESSLSIEQSKQNLYGSIDLRQKNKLQQQMLVDLQQIQKKMDLTRRQIYKMYTQNLKCQQLLTQKVQQRLQTEFQILNPTSYNRQEINDILKSSLIFAFYYSLVLASPTQSVQISKSLEPLTNRPEIFNYCFSVQQNKWERWEEIDTNLTTQSCSSSTSDKTLHPKEILRHNINKFKLNNLKDFAHQIDILHGHQPSLLQMKGPEVYFMKMFLLYKIPFKMTLPEESYPTWLYKYELELLKKRANLNESLRELSQSKNKKILKLLTAIKIKDIVIKHVEIDSKQSLIKWKSAIKYKFIKNSDQWYSIQNTSLIFIAKQKTKIDEFEKIKTFKTHIYIQNEETEKNYFKLLTMIFNYSRFQMLQSQLDNTLLSLKTYQNHREFLQHLSMRLFVSKGLSNSQVQDIYGMKLIITNPEKYNECRKKIKDIINKIKLQQNESKQELLPQQIEKVKTFDRISQINQVLHKMTACVDVKRSEISKNFIIRYMLKRPRKYQRIQSPQTVANKKRIKSPQKVQFDDVLYFDQNYDHTNILFEDLSQIMLFFNLNLRVIIVENNGSYEERIVNKYIKAYKIYKRAIQMMLASKNTKPFTVDVNQLDNFELNLKRMELYDEKSLETIQQELKDNTKQKIRIITVYNQNIIDKVIEIFSEDLIENIMRPKNHYYILLTPQLRFKYPHGFRTIIQNSQTNSHYLAPLRSQKLQSFISKFQQFIKIKSMQFIEKSNIGQSYIPLALEKASDIKIYTSNVKNDLISKRQMFDKTNQDIISAKKSIVECKNSIELNEKSIKQMESSLGYWKLKRDFYIGNEQFKEINKQIREYQRKKLQKQLNRPEFIEDNSYNLSYIYTFNILADNSYFPDKTLPLLDQQYELGKSYQIFEDQKKLFQKHFNYGRLSAIIDNDELVFGEGLIQQDHLNMSNKVRGKFVYLKHVYDQIVQEKSYSKQSPFSLWVILKEELSLIHKYKGNESQQMFNKYIAFLGTHKFIRYIVSKSIETIEQQLKKARESIFKMKETIEHEQLKLSSNKSYLQQIKSKYEIVQRQLQTCKKNQDIFIQQTNQNVLLITSLYFKHLIGINIQYQFEFINKISNEEIRKKQGKKDKNKRSKLSQQEINTEYKNEGIIKQIQNKQIIISIGEYVIDQMIALKRRPLNQKQKQLLITILPRETIQEIIVYNHIETMLELFEHILIYLIKQLFPTQYRVYNEDDPPSQFDYRKFNLISLQKTYKSKTHYFCKQIQSNYKFEIKGLIGRISMKRQILNTTLLKFSQKIGLILPKSSQSILRFLLKQQVVDNIEEFLQNSFKAITNTPTENMYYQGQWIAKNQQKWDFYCEILEKIKQRLKVIYKECYNERLELYFIKMIGMLGKKIPLSCLDAIIDQIYYDHSREKNITVKQVKQIIIQKRYEARLSEQGSSSQKTIGNNKCSYISTLDSLLLTSVNFILVHGSSLLHRILLVKALRGNKILKRKEQIEYYIQQNKSKQYWILITINHEQNLSQKIKKARKLQQQLSITDENHMKFILLFESNVWKQDQLRFVEEEIQPIYRFFFKNSPISIFYHYNFIFQQFSQRSINNQIVTIFAIAKYYCQISSHVPISQIPFSEIQKSHITEVLQNVFDQFDIPAQSLYFRLISTLLQDYQNISKTISQIMIKNDKQAIIQYMPLWSQEPQLNRIMRQIHSKQDIYKKQSLLSLWIQKITNNMGKQINLQKEKLKKFSFSELMKPARDDMGLLLNDIQVALSNPYKFIIINKCFSKLIDRCLSKRQKANNPMQNQANGSFNTKDQKKDIHELMEITNKKELFLQILHGANTTGLRLNNITVQISRKDVSGSIGVFFSIVGAYQEWLNLLFNSELFMSVTDKKHKNINELNFIKGVFFKYSEPIIYVKKQVEFGEEDTNILRPLPQFKNLLPIYTSNNQYIGIIELTTNQQLIMTPTLMIKLKH